MFLGAILLALCASSVAAGLRVMSKVTALHSGVKALNVPGDDHVITLSIGLKLNNIQLLPYYLKIVSTPGNPSYGSYFDKEKVDILFSPTDESRAAVHAWLTKSSVTDISDKSDHINFATTVSNANIMLGAFFQNFDVAGVKKLRTMEYSLPEEVAEHIDLVSPTTFFGRTKAHHVVASGPMLRRRPFNAFQRRQVQPGAALNGTAIENCTTSITPVCLDYLYNYGSYKPDPASGSRVGFGSFLNQSARPRDLNKYQEYYNLPVTNVSKVLINGGEDHSDYPFKYNFREANPDSQFLSAVVGALPVTEFITGGKP